MSQHQDITQLLEAHAAGDQCASEDLFRIVFEELRKIARYRLRRERSDHTLVTTALVHEAYLKLVRLDRKKWQNRAHFFAVASRAMRNILVDYALKRGARKRGAHRHRVAWEEIEPIVGERDEGLIALDQALQRLEAQDERQARVVECRFFGGLNLDETAEALDISPATVSRDWTMARAWLNRELSAGPGSRSRRGKR